MDCIKQTVDMMNKLYFKMVELEKRDPERYAMAVTFMIAEHYIIMGSVEETVGLLMEMDAANPANQEKSEIDKALLKAVVTQQVEQVIKALNLE